MNVKNNAFLVSIMLFLPAIMIISSNSNTWKEVGDHQSSSRLAINQSISHGTISINGNTQLTSFFAGNTTNGSSGNPYMIQGFQINAGGVGSAINIQNTDKHVIIQFCTLSGSTSTGFFNGGIYLYNCSNVIVRWNTSTQNGKNGFVFDTSTNILVTGNSITYNNQDGIAFSYSNNISITNNTILNCTYNGISSHDSGNVTVSTNTITNAGRHGIDFDVIDAPVVITQNSITNCGTDGMWLGTVYDAIIADNTITRCDYYGIEIIDDCCDNNITHNLVTYCTFAGIWLDYGDNITGNIIWWNAFANNRDIQAQSRRLPSGLNEWDHEGLGNYWGDYQTRYPNAVATNNVWSIPYEIDDTHLASDYDHFPLVSIDLIRQNPPSMVDVTVIIVIIVITFVAGVVLVVSKAYKVDVLLPWKRK